MAHRLLPVLSILVTQRRLSSESPDIATAAGSGAMSEIPATAASGRMQPILRIFALCVAGLSLVYLANAY